MSTWDVSIENKLDIWVAGESIGGTQLDNGINDPIFSLGVLQIEFKTFVDRFINILELFGVTSIKAGSNLT